MKRALSKKQYGELIKYVEDMGKGRIKSYALRDETDFLVGAMSAMSFFDIEPPPTWIFNTMRGESIIGFKNGTVSRLNRLMDDLRKIRDSSDVACEEDGCLCNDFDYTLDRLEQLRHDIIKKKQEAKRE